MYTCAHIFALLFTYLLFFWIKKHLPHSCEYEFHFWQFFFFCHTLKISFFFRKFRHCRISECNDDKKIKWKLFIVPSFQVDWAIYYEEHSRGGNMFNIIERVTFHKSYEERKERRNTCIPSASMRRNFPSIPKCASLSICYRMKEKNYKISIDFHTAFVSVLVSP